MAVYEMRTFLLAKHTSSVNVRTQHLHSFSETEEDYGGENCNRYVANDFMLKFSRRLDFYKLYVWRKAQLICSEANLLEAQLIGCFRISNLFMRFWNQISSYPVFLLTRTAHLTTRIVTFSVLSLGFSGDFLLI